MLRRSESEMSASGSRSGPRAFVPAVTCLSAHACTRDGDLAAGLLAGLRGGPAVGNVDPPGLRDSIIVQHALSGAAPREKWRDRRTRREWPNGRGHR